MFSSVKNFLKKPFEFLNNKMNQGENNQNKEKEEEEEAQNNNSDDDTSDTEFNPKDEECNEESENEKCDGGPPSKKSRKSLKKKKKSKKKKKKAIVNGNESTDDDDDEDDLDFVADIEEEEKVEEAPKETEEERKIRELKEKEAIDILYKDFLASVENPEKKLEPVQQNDTVVKIMDFAGEKVEVKEKIKPSNSKATSSNGSIANGKNESPCCSSASSVSDPNECTPGPVDSNGKPIRRGGYKISVLSSTPESLGLNLLGKGGGLSGIIQALNAKKKKLGTLDKSKLDWTDFKKKQGIEEELQNHIKSKERYSDKQNFLHRTDLREFEHEKNIRANTRSRRGT